MSAAVASDATRPLAFDLVDLTRGDIAHDEYRRRITAAIRAELAEEAEAPDYSPEELEPYDEPHTPYGPSMGL